MRQCPRDIFQGEPATLPVCDGLFPAQAIEIDCDVEIRSSQRFDKSRETFAPIPLKNRATAILVRRRTIVGPGMDLESALALRATIAEDSRRPPTLEVSTTPHTYFFHARKLERAIDPAAATPARRPHVPIRVIIKRNEDERSGYLACPQRSEMMEISGAVNKKPGKFAADLTIEGFN